MYDVLLIVPFEPYSAKASDAFYRQTAGAYLNLPLVAATCELEEYVGRPLNFRKPQDGPYFGGKPLKFSASRTLTAVTIASELERSQITWKAIDPGPWELHQWRNRLLKERNEKPVIVAVSTSYVMSAPWLNMLCAIVRQVFNQAKIVVGGYFYANNTAEFLALDADVFFFGRCENRVSQIVEALKRREPLDNIKGLCLKSPDGSLRYTGKFEEEIVNDFYVPDWRLAEKIEPQINLKEEEVEFGVETQRGCPFSCEFCSYRTIAKYEAYPIESSVQAIFNTSISANAYINIVDSTATFPKKRWIGLMEALIQRGGAPHPIWAFGRVSDISKRSAALMAKAGVRHLFIGQESGDQTILDKMKKGTNVRQVKETLKWLGKYGIGATFAFMHGFPGETTESIRATRDMICGLNEGHEMNPVVLIYMLFPFIYMDFAKASNYSSMQKVSHYLGYYDADITPQRASEEVLATVIAASKISHAPPFAFLFDAEPATTGLSILSSPFRQEIFRWLKAVERGVTIFLEKNLDGKKVDDAELRHVKRTILSRYKIGRRAFKKPLNSVSCKLRRNLYERLRKEWINEDDGDEGLYTRLLLSQLLGEKRINLSNFFKALTGRRPGERGLIYEVPAIENKSIMELASQIRREVLVKH